MSDTAAPELNEKDVAEDLADALSSAMEHFCEGPEILTASPPALRLLKRLRGPRPGVPGRGYNPEAKTYCGVPVCREGDVEGEDDRPPRIHLAGRNYSESSYLTWEDGEWRMQWVNGNRAVDLTLVVRTVTRRRVSSWEDGGDKFQYSMKFEPLGFGIGMQEYFQYRNAEGDMADLVVHLDEREYHRRGIGVGDEIVVRPVRETRVVGYEVKE